MWRDRVSSIKEHKDKLHTKLIVFFVLLVCVIMLIQTYRYNTLNKLVEESESSYISSQKIVDVRDKVDALKVSFENYLSSKDKTDKAEYRQSEQRLLLALDNIYVNEKFTDKNIKLVNLYHMSGQYIELINKMIADTKNITNDNVKEATKLYQYIQEYSNEIMGEQLLMDTRDYTALKKDVGHINLVSYIVEVIVLVGGIICIVVFSVYITRPIKKLTDKTITVSEGNYNLIVHDEDAIGEVGELYDSFNKMTRSIKDDVDGIKRARVLEQALAREKIANLNMANALKEAEYNALQSQVNPHFIFNTINIGAQLAMLNEDDDTCEYLQSAARLFRYNLNGLKHNVPLDREIENVSSYIGVMQTRYGENIEYIQNINSDIEVENIVLPKMTLQPLVEFLYINSVNSLEEGGTVKVLVSKTDTHYMIDIQSSGKEIEQATINRVIFDDVEDIDEKKLAKMDKIEEKEYYMSVLGVRNSIRRLKLLYERKDVILIRRDEDINYITIKVPVEFEVKDVTR